MSSMSDGGLSQCVGLSVFDVQTDLLTNFSKLKTSRQSSGVRDLMQTVNTSALLKFCDVCKFLNLDPLHHEALPVVVIFMCKSKHCYEIAQAYLQTCGCQDFLEGVCAEDRGEGQLLGDEHTCSVAETCDQMLNSMADWLTLFSYFEHKHLSKDASGQKRAHDLEQNNVLKRMLVSLNDALVRPAGPLPKHKLNMPEVAVLALLYMSPRKTPAGKMLEWLYTEINEQARDAELRCLRAMTAFSDTMDDERAYSDTLPLVLQSLSVRDDFKKNVAAVLRRQMADADVMRLEHNQASTRPLLRTYAQNAVAHKQTLSAMASWQEWRTSLNFPVTTSSHLQRLLYFVCVQQERPRRETYELHYTKDLCDKATANSVDFIDPHAIIMVIESVRLYQSNIKHLIDFSAKCLQGLNQKTRQGLAVVKVLQLYIASFQHESIWKACWRNVVPIMNHTINSDVMEFRKKHTFDVNPVVQNLLGSLIDDT